MEKIKTWFVQNKDLALFGLIGLFLLVGSGVYIFNQVSTSREPKEVENFSVDGLVNKKKAYESKRNAYKEREKRKYHKKGEIVSIEKKVDTVSNNVISDDELNLTEEEKRAIVENSFKGIRKETPKPQSQTPKFDPYGNSDMWEIKDPTTPISIPQTSPNVRYTSTPVIEKEEEEEMTYYRGGIAQARRNKSQTSGNFKESKTSTKLIEAKIIAGGDQKNRVTPKNPYVEIRLLEPMWINGYELKKNKVLIAEASFSKRLSLKIHHILKDKQSIPCDIEIYDVNGQPALKVIGGTGAEIEEEVSDDIGDDIASNSDIQKVPGASSIIEKIFNKNKKVYIRPTMVYLKINS